VSCQFPRTPSGMQACEDHRLLISHDEVIGERKLTKERASYVSVNDPKLQRRRPEPNKQGVERIFKLDPKALPLRLIVSDGLANILLSKRP
jgi:hypothetical protein